MNAHDLKRVAATLRRLLVLSSLTSVVPKNCFLCHSCATPWQRMCIAQFNPVFLMLHQFGSCSNDFGVKGVTFFLDFGLIFLAPTQHYLSHRSHLGNERPLSFTSPQIHCWFSFQSRVRFNFTWPHAQKASAHVQKRKEVQIVGVEPLPCPCEPLGRRTRRLPRKRCLGSPHGPDNQ